MSNKRDKLTDRINAAEYLFKTKTSSFNEAYPTVISLTFDIVESSHTFGSSSKKWTLTEANFQHAINCSNAGCYSGGVELGIILEDMVHNKQSQYENNIICQGYEGSPKGRRQYGRCNRSFHIKALVVFKEDSIKSNPQNPPSPRRGMSRARSLHMRSRRYVIISHGYAYRKGRT